MTSDFGKVASSWLTCNWRTRIAPKSPSSPTPIQLYNLTNATYSAQWFNPASNQTTAGKVQTSKGVLTATPPAGGEDWVLVLRK
ncbi:MAG: hypothetical protein KKG00_17060 [Bacteroidetes bacterium]|nr:hypothetical protein [Bacteroidota bacterium]